MTPCCCITSKTGSLVIGAVHIILGLGTILTINMLTAVEALKRSTIDEDEDETLTFIRALVIIRLVYGVLLAILGVVLVVGVDKAIPWLLKSWIKIKVFVLASAVGVLIYAESISPGLLGFPVISIILTGTLFYLWTLAVVFHFLKFELPHEIRIGRSNSTKSNLHLTEEMHA